MKQEILNEIEELRNKLENMRENGETDIRTVIHITDYAYSVINEKLDDYIILSKDDYEYMSENAKKFEYLEIHGVDNWQGYGDAMEMMYGEEDDF